MNSSDISKGLLKTLLVLAGIALLVWFLYTLKLLIASLFISMVISFIGNPIVRVLETKLRFRRLLAVLVTMLLFVGGLACLVLLFIPLIKSQGETLASLNSEKIKQILLDSYNEVQAYLKAQGINTFDNLASNLLEYVNHFTPLILGSIVSNLKNIGVIAFSVTFISFFFMKDPQMFERILLTPFPQKNQEKVHKSLYKIKRLLSNYFIGVCFQLSLLFVIYSATLLIFGVRNALPTAVLCTLLNLIPYIGPISGGVLIFFSAMTSFLGNDFYAFVLPRSLYVLAGFVVGQLIDMFFSQPFIFSKSVKSHPLEIFLVIVTGGMLSGVIGMMAAVPVYTCLKVITKEFLADNTIVKSLTKDI